MRPEFQGRNYRSMDQICSTDSPNNSQNFWMENKMQKLELPLIRRLLPNISKNFLHDSNEYSYNQDLPICDINEISKIEQASVVNPFKRKQRELFMTQKSLPKLPKLKSKFKGKLGKHPQTLSLNVSDCSDMR